MKILKTILVVIVAIIAFLLIIALFVPKNFEVRVSQTVNQPKQMVYDYLRLLDNQKEYSVWVMQDPNLNPEISGTDGTVGAVQKWNSKMDDVGEGEQEITALSPDRIEVEIRFKRPFEGKARAANTFKVISENQTEVISEFYSEGKYPFNLMAYFFGRPMMEKAEKQNLDNVKRILESGKNN